ncbi:protein PET117 homolog, mitochondrial-like [Penaeus japonicus]|uniref:protein PET117 homolog, mitochondrial-like n=1 Tax=Penaeus japonicus TaxID=27405 RepID=UPI001C713DAB|nr:protein PET117 homolog, mitochondrial-like [Penaeus japonicus]
MKILIISGVREAILTQMLIYWLEPPRRYCTNMSLASKVTLGASCVATAAIVGYVHIKQNIDREKLHEGVIKDVERQQRRKAENLYVLQQQSDLTKQLRREQMEAQKQSSST